MLQQARKLFITMSVIIEYMPYAIATNHTQNLCFSQPKINRPIQIPKNNMRIHVFAFCEKLLTLCEIRMSLPIWKWLKFLCGIKDFVL